MKRKSEKKTTGKTGFSGRAATWTVIAAIWVCSGCGKSAPAVDPLELIRVKALVAAVAVCESKPAKNDRQPELPIIREQQTEGTPPAGGVEASLSPPPPPATPQQGTISAGEAQGAATTQNPDSPARNTSPQGAPADHRAGAQDAPRPIFQAKMAPSSSRRKLVILTAGWCRACPAHKAEMDRFASYRGLSGGEVEYQEFDQNSDTSGPRRRKRNNVTELPITIIEDGNGNELARRAGKLSFAEIEDLWLSGPSRAHALDGLPLDRAAFALSPEVESILSRLPQLVKQSKFSVLLNSEIKIPLSGVGEIVVPNSVSMTAGPVAGGFAANVDPGTPCPWVKSKWMGTLYPIPILGVTVGGNFATVRLRGWKDLTISLQ